MVLGALPEIVPGDDLAGMLAAVAMDAGLEPGDVVSLTVGSVASREGRRWGCCARHRGSFSDGA